MAIDYSKFSDEELEKIAAGAGNAVTPQDETGGLGQYLKGLGKGIANFGGGAMRGTGQAIGDLGASAINWPIEGAEYLSGHKLPHVPHPHLINENPESMSESIGQILGHALGGFALPGGAVLKGTQLANKGYQALRAGKELPLLGKLLAGSAGGALEGAAGNEDNRNLGAKVGALLGGGAQGLSSAYRMGMDMKSKNIAKDIQKEVKRLEEHFNARFTNHLQSGEEAGANQFLRSEKADIKLLKRAGEGKLAYGIEKFNENPTLTNAHKAQSDLNKIVAKYAKSKSGTIKEDVYDEALKLKNRLLQKISEAFEKSGAKPHGEGYQQARIDYATQAAPYRDSEAIKGLLGKNPKGVQTVRPNQFADKLLQEEEFLAQVGKKHPSLLHREKTKSLIKHPVTKLGSVAAIASLPLSYEIKKLLGSH